MRRIGGVVILWGLLGGSATAQAPYLVRDINPGGTAYPSLPVEVNGAALFFANDGVHGPELWRSDGTAAGTRLVKDIIPGSDPGFGALFLTGAGSQAFFRVDTFTTTELWRSDGTEAGTVAVRSFALGGVFSLAAANGRVFFAAGDSPTDNELWTSDGTSAGTYRVKDIRPGPFGSLPQWLTAAGNRLFFSAQASEATSGDLWVTDGTEAGTVLLKEDCWPHHLSAVGGSLYFRGYDAAGGSELWASDGTPAGTRRVKDIYPGAGGSDPLGFVDLNGTALFIAVAPGLGRELWRSDGTEAGTQLVADFEPGELSGMYFDDPMVKMGGYVYLSPIHPTHYLELWRTDGTPAGTTVVKDLSVDSGSWPRLLTAVGDRLFFIANDGVAGYEPWMSDGTEAGTVRIGDLIPGPAENHGAVRFMTRVGPRVFFSHTDFIGPLYDELWAIAPVTVQAAALTVAEGADGAVTTANVTVTLGGIPTGSISLQYRTDAGSATAGADFGATSGTVTFPPGVLQRTVRVAVFGDHAQEGDETFRFLVSGQSQGVPLGAEALVTIADDDAPGLSVAGAAVRERVGVTTTARVTVTLAPVAAGTVTVGYATEDGTATAGADYVAAAGVLTFAPGATTATVDVTVSPDGLAEGMETFRVRLSGPSGAPIAVAEATARILDPATQGDLDRDGRNDLVWRHERSGQNVLWFMNGASLLNGTFTTPAVLADARWKIAGTHDFDADGRPDLLWRHTASGENVLWYMNGAVLVSGGFLTPAALTDVRWQVAGTADFDLDGDPDILWRHTASGEMVLWSMNGSVLAGGTFLTPDALPGAWTAAGTGDFDLDGRPDILWHHPPSGQLAVWFMRGSALASGSFLNPPSLPDVGWRPVAVADYNQDGRVDIVWRHVLSGQNAVWFLSGTDLVSGAFTTPSTVADPDWRIVGPR
jgi:ELWxxDGT repeat protein